MLLKAIERNTSSKSIYFITLWTFVYALTLTLIFSGLLYLTGRFFNLNFVDKIGSAKAQLHIEWFPTLVFNPLVESLLLSIILWLMDKKVNRKILVILTPAFFLATLHSLQNLSWGLTIFWMFLVHCYVFFKIIHFGYFRALLIISIAHMLQNGFILSILTFF